MARNTQVAADHNAPPVTRTLAKFVATHPSRGWSDAVDHEAHRTFLNWAGCAVGAARHEAAQAALEAVAMLKPAPQSTLLGRAERVDMASAALINGISSHLFDFDDTHLKTIIHPAGPRGVGAPRPGGSHRRHRAAGDRRSRAGHRRVVPPRQRDVPGPLRPGLAHHRVHGKLGAAAGCARLLGLDEEKTAMALGIAASQPVGMREQFGTMTKPFHPGGAARAGLLSALLAKHGFTASPKAIEAPRGYVQVVSTKCDWSEATGELGRRCD